MSELTADDVLHLCIAIGLARKARLKGNRPYGALLVGGDGKLLAQAQNTQVTDGDCTGHAEMNLVRGLARKLDSRTLAGATLYASAEPCAMCAAAIFWSGIGRVVYALGSERNYALLPPSDDALRMGCREVLERGKRRVDVLGPALEEEAVAAFGGRSGDVARTA